MNNIQQPIAIGRTAEVYPLEGGKVLKLFLPTIPQAWIDKEAETGRYIQNARLPVPEIFGQNVCSFDFSGSAQAL